MSETIFTVGHSTKAIGDFIQLLLDNRIEAIGDVRSVPFSRLNPQFSQNELKRELHENEIRYVFLGKELGARPKDRKCYEHGAAKYELIARSKLFREGIGRVLKGAQEYRIALMCSEKEPLDCHRTVLVARELVAKGCKVQHILADGGVEAHEDTEKRLMELTKQETRDLFLDNLDRAYELRGEKICFREADENEEAHFATYP